MDFPPLYVEKKSIPNYMKYILGGMAGMMGTCFVQPLDLVKTRMQTSGTDGKKVSAIALIKNVFANEGPLAFYKGLGAGLLRQATYTTARMGVYQTTVQMYRDRFEKAPNVAASMAMGILAGAVGAFVGTPADLALIRMMSDGKLPPAERRNYKNVADALMRIVSEEGLFGLWRGCLPTVGRAMIVNMVQLSSYSQIKMLFKNKFHMNEGLPLQINSSMCSGFLTSVASMPLDMAKTRIQNMKTIDGKPEYTGSMDVMVKVLKNEGFFALWKGFVPYFARVGPHTVFALVFLEQLTKLYYRFVMGEEDGGSSM